MKLTFIGVGGAFAPISVGNSNMMIESQYGRRMIIDMGTTFPYIFRDELGYQHTDIDAVWISHLHADHAGGLEWLGFTRYFMPKKDLSNNRILPKLYMNQSLMQELWEKTLQGGMLSIEGKVMNLTDYFDCYSVEENESFVWDDILFTPVQTIHVVSGYVFRNSYGLLIKSEKGNTIFITTDTQFAPYQMREFYNRANIIFHDCETSQFKSHVHANYVDLITLPEEVKRKMWLYHYGNSIDTAEKDGFLGFVKKGQFFNL